MRLHPASRAARAAVIAVALTLVPMGASRAATTPAWAPGACFTAAEIQNDLLVLSSAVPCDQPHTVQTVGGGPLPATFAGFSLTQLKDQSNTTLRKALADLGDQICSGKVTAPNIWPKQGAAVANALTGLAASTGGGVLPGVGEGMNFGWVFPDAASFDAGDRSMVCVVFSADSKSGGTTATVDAMHGNLQDLGTNATLASMRECSVYNAKTKLNATVSCAKPHDGELIAHYVARLPADFGSMTDAQWVPFDAQCKALMDALVGAKRSDLKAIANPSAKAKANTTIYIPCYVSHARSAHGTQPKLPGGTVIGLGTKQLKAA